MSTVALEGALVPLEAEVAPERAASNGRQSAELSHRLVAPASPPLGVPGLPARALPAPTGGVLAGTALEQSVRQAVARCAASLGEWLRERAGRLTPLDTSVHVQEELGALEVAVAKRAAAAAAEAAAMRAQLDESSLAHAQRYEDNKRQVAELERMRDEGALRLRVRETRLVEQRKAYAPLPPPPPPPPARVRARARLALIHI